MESSHWWAASAGGVEVRGLWGYLPATMVEGLTQIKRVSPERKQRLNSGPRAEELRALPPQHASVKQPGLRLFYTCTQRLNSEGFMAIFALVQLAVPFGPGPM